MDFLMHPSVALRRLRVLPRWVRRLDARAAKKINRHRQPPQLDRGLARLSHLADRSALWVVIASVLFVRGGAQRRGAARGVASLVVGSVIANLVGKRVFGGERPLLKDVPVPRRLKSVPTSASFPSGHSASAAAFAVGVALESPRTGAALAPLGAAVAYSRLHTGAHWLSDVVGGAALGAAVAVAGAMLVPVGSGREQQRPTRTVDLPALREGSGLLVLANPDSGTDPLRPAPEEFLAATLPAADVHVLREGEDVADIVRDALAGGSPPQVLGGSPPQVLGIWGGDGSVAAAAHAARTAELPLLVLPGGTFNHFARTAGAATPEQAIEALHRGAGRRVDVAELSIDDDDPVTVMNAASVGVYPDFVAERERVQRRWGKPIAALIAAVRVLAHARTIDVTVNGRRATVWSVAVAAGRNTSASMVPLQRRSLDDAVLDVRVLHAGGRMPRLRGVVALAFGARVSATADRLPWRHGSATIERFTAESVSIEAQAQDGRPVSIAHDGEVSTDAPPVSDGRRSAMIAIVPAGLAVYGLGE